MLDKSFNKYLHITKAILPRDNNYPSSYTTTEGGLCIGFIRHYASVSIRCISQRCERLGPYASVL
ncbi:unnamed protein product [Rhodiola kirilowii]